jgi:hypothetical protein
MKKSREKCIKIADLRSFDKLKAGSRLQIEKPQRRTNVQKEIARLR